MNWKNARQLYCVPTLLIYIITFAAQCSRTMFILIICWYTVSTTDDVSSVGRVLVWSPLLNIIMGPTLGVVVDHFNRRNLFIIGEIIRIAGLIWLVVNIQLDSVELTRTVSLHSSALIVYFGALLSIPSMQGLLQTIGGKTHARIVIGAVSVGLAAEAVGAVVGGIALARFGTTISLMICIAFSVVAAAFATFLNAAGRVPACTKGFSYLTAITEGLRIIIGDRQLLMTFLALTCTWAVAQTSLALLAGFTRIELRLDADAYGWIDAVWGVGGIGGGIALSCIARQAIDRNLPRYALLFLAIATAGFSVTQGFWSALLLHGLMGAAFAMNLALCNAHILGAVDPGAIGRVRNNLQATTGAVGVAVFLSPNIYGDTSVRAIYWGLSLILAGAATIHFIAYSRSHAESEIE